MKLYYFPFPGRAECARLCLTLGNVPFEDVCVQDSEWPGLKPKMPFHQMPVLELDDGRMIAQMAAIDRYCGALAGLLPANPLQCAKAEEAYCFIEDVWQPIMPVMMAKYADEAEKAAGWKALVAGPLGDKLTLLEQYLAKRAGKYVGGDELSYCDLSMFGTLSLFQSGWMQGLPRDILSSYPALQQFRNQVASLPQVAAYYREQSKGDEVRRAFLPDDCQEEAKHSLAAATQPAEAPQGITAGSGSL